MKLTVTVRGNIILSGIASFGMTLDFRGLLIQEAAAGHDHCMLTQIVNIAGSA